MVLTRTARKASSERPGTNIGESRRTDCFLTMTHAVLPLERPAKRMEHRSARGVRRQ